MRRALAFAAVLLTAACAAREASVNAHVPPGDARTTTARAGACRIECEDADATCATGCRVSSTDGGAACADACTARRADCIAACDRIDDPVVQ